MKNSKSTGETCEDELEQELVRLMASCKMPYGVCPGLLQVSF